MNEIVPLERIWARTEHTRSAPTPVRGGHMPAALRRRYGGGLAIPLREGRATFIANFVSTLDGVVALDAAGASGGAEISGSFEPDQFVMGLLRCISDAVLVGSGTVRAAPDHRWTADQVHPPEARAFARWRRALGLSTQPTTIVVTASGHLDPTHPGLADPSIPVVIATTGQGADTARSRGFGGHVAIEAVGTDRAVGPQGLRSLVASLGLGVVLCEGGPHLLAQIIGAGMLDELFLTVAPQLVGRGAGPSRLSLLEGTAFPPEAAPWFELLSVRRAADHLFLRYALTGTRTPAGQ